MTNETVIGLDDTHGLIGNPIDVFNSLGSDIQGWIVFVTGLLALIFLIATIVSIFGHGISSGVASVQRDSAGRTHHVMGILSAIITVILVIIGMAMLFAIYF
jgi:hypothetical protein